MAQYQSKIENIFGIPNVTLDTPYVPSMQGDSRTTVPQLELHINDKTRVVLLSSTNVIKAFKDITGHDITSGSFSNGVVFATQKAVDGINYNPGYTSSRVTTSLYEPLVAYGISSTSGAFRGLNFRYTHVYKGINVSASLELASTTPIATIEDIKNLFKNAGYKGPWDIVTPAAGWAIPKITSVDVTGQASTYINFVNTSPTTVTKVVYGSDDPAIKTTLTDTRLIALTARTQSSDYLYVKNNTHGYNGIYERVKWPWAISATNTTGRYVINKSRDDGYSFIQMPWFWRSRDPKSINGAKAEYINVMMWDGQKPTGGRSMSWYAFPGNLENSVIGDDLAVNPSTDEFVQDAGGQEPNPIGIINPSKGGGWMLYNYPGLT